MDHPAGIRITVYQEAVYHEIPQDLVHVEHFFKVLIFAEALQ